MMENSLNLIVRRSRSHLKVITFLVCLTYFLSALIFLNTAELTTQVNAQSDSPTESETPFVGNHTFKQPFVLAESPIILPTSAFTPNLYIIRTSAGATTLFSTSTQADQLLAEAGIEYDRDDIISVQLDHQLGNFSIITVTRVDTTHREEQVSIPYATLIEEDPELAVGIQQVTTKGVLGLKSLNYIATTSDGILISEQLSGENVIKAPITEVIVKGTKKPPPVITYTNNSCVHWDGVIDGMTRAEDERLWLKHLMRCESSCNANSVSKTGLYHGLMQFSPPTFYTTFRGVDIYDGYEQVEYALSIYRSGPSVRSSQFPGCNR